MSGGRSAPHEVHTSSSCMGHTVDAGTWKCAALCHVGETLSAMGTSSAHSLCTTTSLDPLPSRRMIRSGVASGRRFGGGGPHLPTHPWYLAPCNSPWLIRARSCAGDTPAQTDVESSFWFHIHRAAALLFLSFPPRPPITSIHVAFFLLGEDAQPVVARGAQDGGRG